MVHESGIVEDLERGEHRVGAGRAEQVTPAGRICVSVPPQWTWSEKLSLLSPDEDVAIDADIDRLSEVVTVEEIAEAAGDRLRSSIAGYEEIRLERVVLLGAETALLREFRCTLEGEARTRVMQVYAVLGDRRLRASATVPEELASTSRRADMLRTLLSLSVSAE